MAIFCWLMVARFRATLYSKKINGPNIGTDYTTEQQFCSYSSRRDPGAAMERKKEHG